MNGLRGGQTFWNRICSNRVMVQVSCEVTSPKQTRPSEGIVFVNVELSPMAAPQFEAGRFVNVCSWYAYGIWLCWSRGINNVFKKVQTVSLLKTRLENFYHQVIGWSLVVDVLFICHEFQIIRLRGGAEQTPWKVLERIQMCWHWIAVYNGWYQGKEIFLQDLVFCSVSV